ncbi:MAG: hypothetical protein JO186_01060 [Actinobacteria bacterium]|nr:hypothetical protein [Actinomycetota bacterium]
MYPPLAPGGAVRLRRRQAVREARRRQLAVLVVIGVVALALLLVTAFGGSDHPAVRLSAPASATRLLPVGPPKPQVIARVGSLALQLPVNRVRVTAIGYAGGIEGDLALSPVGGQANEGLLKRLFHAVIGGGGGSPRWYQLAGGAGPSTSALDVGAPPGTDVYAPVDGTVVGIQNVVLNGSVHGQRVDIQPSGAPSLVVSLSQLRADPSLSVGSTVTASASKLGRILDLSKVEKQALAHYTNDAGNHVLVEVHPAATLQVP